MHVMQCKFTNFFKVEGGRMGLRDRERDQEALAYIYIYALFAAIM